MSETEIPKDFARVTEVLECYSDFSAICPKVLANAADRGQRVHNYCEMINLSLFLPEIDADCVPFVECYQKWHNEHVDEVISAEIRLNCPRHMISGQIDIICRLKGSSEIYIIDIKTPVACKKAWHLQTAAYKLLAREQLNISGASRSCLMLSRTGGKAKLKPFSNPLDETRFLHALDLYRYFRNEERFIFFDVFS